MDTASHLLPRLPATLVASLALLLASCSSVKVSVKNGEATREALKSANLLQDLAGAPTAALAVFAKGSEKLIGSARAHEWASPRDAAAVT